jgi:hypothetical protein
MGSETGSGRAIAAPAGDPREALQVDKPSRETHLHDEEDGHAETGAEADDGGDDDGDGLLIESHLRELGDGGGHRGIAAATG